LALPRQCISDTPFLAYLVMIAKRHATGDLVERLNNILDHEKLVAHAQMLQDYCSQVLAENEQQALSILDMDPAPVTLCVPFSILNVPVFEASCCSYIRCSCCHQQLLAVRVDSAALRIKQRQEESDSIDASAKTQYFLEHVACSALSFCLDITSTAATKKEVEAHLQIRLKEARQLGVMTIAYCSHTSSHPNLLEPDSLHGNLCSSDPDSCCTCFESVIIGSSNKMTVNLRDFKTLRFKNIFCI